MESLVRIRRISDKEKQIPVVEGKGAPWSGGEKDNHWRVGEVKSVVGRRIITGVRGESLVFISGLVKVRIVRS